MLHWSQIGRAISDLRLSCLQGSSLASFQYTRKQGISITRDAALRLLQGCEKRKDLQSARRVKTLIGISGLDYISVLGDHLIRLFFQHGNLVEGNQVYNTIAKPSAYTWSSLIMAHAKLKRGQKALELYYRMKLSGVKADTYVYVAILNSCAIISALIEGRLLHEEIIQQEIQSDVAISNTLIDLYVEVGNFKEALNVFNHLPAKDAISWNSMISGYILHGEYFPAISCFERMSLEGVEPSVVSWGILISGYVQNGNSDMALKVFEKLHMEGVKPNEIILTSVLQACASTKAINHGRLIHDQIIKGNVQLDVLMGNNLVDMYAKCGSWEEAQEIFDVMPNQDLMSWNIIIAAYSQHGKGILSLECFEMMQEAAIEPDTTTFLNALEACACIGALQKGRFIHDQISSYGLELDVLLGSAMVHMYAKCGSISEADKAFKKLQNLDAASWNTMISGYAEHGESRFALEYFELMQSDGMQLNEQLFTSILMACCHEGLVEEGYWHFRSMSEHYNTLPTTFHFTCMVDLLGRAGCLSSAANLLQLFQQHNVTGWRSLLSASKVYKHVDLARHCFHQVVSLDPICAAGYVLMANVYAND